MYRKHSLIVATLAISLGGCATQVGNQGADSSSARAFAIEAAPEAGKSLIQVASENNERIEKGMQEVLDFCLTRLSGYERDSATQARRSYWLSMSGLITGSVLAPALAAGNAAANATAVAALSGWAGATNFAGQALRSSGLSGSTIAETRNSIIRSVRDSLKVAGNGSESFDERRAALMTARADCILYEIAVPAIPTTN